MLPINCTCVLEAPTRAIFDINFEILESIFLVRLDWILVT